MAFTFEEKISFPIKLSFIIMAANFTYPKS